MSNAQKLEIKTQSWKIQFFIMFTACFFLIIFFRLFYLQVQQGEKLKVFSNSNRFKKQLFLAPRGLILDRYGLLLVGNQKLAQAIIYLDRGEYSKKSIEKVSKILNMKIKTLKQKIEKQKKQNGIFYPIVLKQNLSLTEIHKIKQLHWSYADLQVRELEKRVYPLKNNMAQVLGFIGAVSKKDLKELKSKNQQISLRDIRGKSGLEKRYNTSLKGQNGFLMLEVNAQNQLIKPQIFPHNFLKIAAKPGDNLILTIDRDLQKFAYKAMNKTDSIGPRTGAVIVMKTNGEILTMLSKPGFDPNILSSQIYKILWDEWSAKGSKVFINKSLQEHYSPGSIFKPFIALAALQEGFITKTSLLHSPGSFKVGNHTYHDHNILGHGDINVITALEKSANSFFYNLASQFEIEKMYHYTRLFGFGRRTQIALSGESLGLLPDPVWKKRNKKENWYKGDTINFSIGQGYLLTTLLQITVAYNAIATNGLIFKPFIVKQLGKHKTKTKVLDSLTDSIQRQHFLTIKEGLRRVVQGEQGTARGYRLDSIPFSGKTGTSQVSSFSKNNIYIKCKKLPKSRRHHGWFVGFAPSAQTEIVVAVFTEHSCSGSKGSAVIARDIIKFYYQNKKSKRT